jgi:uncharacterized protein involved in high-affinity Fe2+ transport
MAKHYQPGKMKKLKMIVVFSLFFLVLSAQKYQEVHKQDLPRKIDSYIRSNQKDATFFKAVKQEEKGITTYDVALDIHGKKQILVFDKNGKYVRKGDKLPAFTDKSSAKHTVKSTTSVRQSPNKPVPKNSTTEKIN